MILLCVSLTSSAQVKVSGRVVDLQNNPVSNVIVKALEGSKTVAFTSTNQQGTYSMQLTQLQGDDFMLMFSHLSFEKDSVKLEASGKELRQDMVLYPRTMALREVKIKGRPLWQKGDTLSHNLASFLGKGDVTLEDGLKRLPGVDVAQSGAISYMGKQISQFNIEGMDLLGGKYNLATRNIPADYVTNVEIVRNHHSRKIEKDLPSDEVSMNIKLAQKAKFKPFGQEEAGVGWMQDGKDELQALLGGTGMMFTDKFQTICSLKGADYKSFAHADMYDHFGGSGISTRATGLFGGFDGGAPPTGEYAYQRNAMATLNAIQKFDSITTAKVNADYSYHQATHDISQQSVLMAGDGDYVTVSETTSPLSKIHLPKLSMNYLRNGDNLYLNEKFVIKGKFDQNEGDIFSNQQQVEQRRRTSSFEIANELNWMTKNAKGTRRGASTSISFKRTPTLRLAFNSLPNGGRLEEAYGQTAQSSTLTMNASTSYSIPVGKTFRLNLPVSVYAAYDDLETHRIPQGDFNHIRGWAFTPTLSPGFDIQSKNKRFYFNAAANIAIKGLYYNRLDYTRMQLNPRIGASYTFNANNKISFNTSYNTNVGDMMTLLTSPMQLNYRTVYTSSGIIGVSKGWNSSIQWKFQLPMQYFTMNVGANHSSDKRNTLNSQSISGIDISNHALLRDSRSQSTGFNISTTKNIPPIYSKLKFDANYGFGSSEQAVSDNIIKVRSNNYGLKGNVSVTPVSWLELNYNINYGWSRTKYSETSNTWTSLTHSGAVHFFPVSKIDLSLDYDHVRRQISTDHYKHMSLFNASVQYKLKQCVLRLELSNLLNQRHYSYTLFDGINTYTYDYGLCGRTIMLRTTFRL
mgnify:FL=1